MIKFWDPYLLSTPVLEGELKVTENNLEEALRSKDQAEQSVTLLKVRMASAVRTRSPQLAIGAPPQHRLRCLPLSHHRRRHATTTMSCPPPPPQPPPPQTQLSQEKAAFEHDTAALRQSLQDSTAGMTDLEQRLQANAAAMGAAGGGSASAAMEELNALKLQLDLETKEQHRTAIMLKMQMEQVGGRRVRVRAKVRVRVRVRVRVGARAVVSTVQMEGTWPCRCPTAYRHVSASSARATERGAQGARQPAGRRAGWGLVYDGPRARGTARDGRPQHGPERAVHQRDHERPLPAPVYPEYPRRRRGSRHDPAQEREPHRMRRASACSTGSSRGSSSELGHMGRRVAKTRAVTGSAIEEPAFTVARANYGSWSARLFRA